MNIPSLILMIELHFPKKKNRVTVDGNQQWRRNKMKWTQICCNSMQSSWLSFSLSLSQQRGLSLFLCGPELTVIPKQSALIQRVRGLECGSAREFVRPCLEARYRTRLRRSSKPRCPEALSQRPFHPLTLLTPVRLTTTDGMCALAELTVNYSNQLLL